MKQLFAVLFDVKPKHQHRLEVLASKTVGDDGPRQPPTDKQK